MMDTVVPLGEPTTSNPNVLGRSIRPLVIESPRYTAADIVWPSFEQMRDGGADIFFAGGTWWRHVWQHDPSRKRVDAHGVLQIPRVQVRRSVWLTQAEAIRNRGDFWYVNPDGPTYGVHGLWMRNGVKPEVDPGVWFASQMPKNEVPEPDTIVWDAVAPAEQAAYQFEQERLRQSTPLDPVYHEQPAAKRGTGRPRSAPADGAEEG